MRVSFLLPAMAVGVLPFVAADCPKYKGCSECINGESWLGDDCFWNPDVSACETSCQAGPGRCTERGGKCTRSNNYDQGDRGSPLVPQTLQPCYQHSNCQNDYFNCEGSSDCAKLLRDWSTDWNDGFSPLAPDQTDPYSSYYQNYYDCMKSSCRVNEYGLTRGEWEGTDSNSGGFWGGCNLKFGLFKAKTEWDPSMTCSNLSGKTTSNLIPAKCVVSAQNNQYPTPRPTRAPTPWGAVTHAPTRTPLDTCNEWRLSSAYSGSRGVCMYWSEEKDHASNNNHKHTFTLSLYETSNIRQCPETSWDASSMANNYRSNFNEIAIETVALMPTVSISTGRSYRRQASKAAVRGDKQIGVLEEGKSTTIYAELSHPAHRNITLELEGGNTVTGDTVKGHEGHLHIVIPKGATSGELVIVNPENDDDKDGQFARFSLKPGGANGAVVRKQQHVGFHLIDNDGTHCVDSKTGVNCDPDNYDGKGNIVKDHAQETLDDHGDDHDHEEGTVHSHEEEGGDAGRRLLFGGVHTTVGPKRSLRFCECHDDGDGSKDHD